MERSTCGLFQCLLRLHTLPVSVVHGQGATMADSHVEAARNALQYLKIMASEKGGLTTAWDAGVLLDCVVVVVTFNCVGWAISHNISDCLLFIFPADSLPVNFFLVISGLICQTNIDLPFLSVHLSVLLCSKPIIRLSLYKRLIGRDFWPQFNPWSSELRDQFKSFV